MPADGARRGLSLEPKLTENFLECVEEEIDVRRARVDVRRDADLGAAQSPDFALGEFGPERRVIGPIHFKGHHAAVKSGVTRTEQFHIRELLGAAIRVLREMMNTVIDAMGSELIDEAQRFEHTFEFRAIVAAKQHVLHGVLRVLPAIDNDSGPELALEITMDIKDAATGRREHPLMQTAREDITTKIVQPKGHLARKVCAIDHRDDALGPSGIANFTDWKEQARMRCDTREREHASFWLDLRQQRVGDLVCGLGRDGDLGFANLDAGARLPEQPAAASGGMFLIGHQNFVASLEIKAVRDQAHRFGGVVGEGELFLTGAEKPGESAAVRVHCFVAPARILIGSVACTLGQIVVGSFDNTIGRGPDAAGVEIGSPVG